MTLAVRGVVELFRLVKREKELHRAILAFSISHDHATVRIYGYYPVIGGNKTTFYRHPIHKFDFTTLDGKEKWTAYKFTKNSPADIDFDVSQGSELQFTEASGLSQDLGGLLSEELNVEHFSRASQDCSNLAPNIPHKDTPVTPLSQEKDQAALKRPKRKHTTK
ncbi:hypothetical protein MMC31_003320 [Peltigera leucophlebia]|nr:hypothetical protein [Peltigera leucophlebia]